jgi:hypothetical protein
VSERVICENKCHHGFPNRDRTNSNAGIVTAFGRNVGIVACDINGAARR